MKKLLILLTTFIVVASLSGCGKEKIDSSVNIDKNIEHRQDYEGVADKDIKDLDGSFSKEVMNDKTGNLRYSSFVKPENFKDYALSYGKAYVKSKDELHYVMNFQNKVMSSIKDMGDYYVVRDTEHVKGEEHDADTIGSGMLLAEYNVYKDNGDIVKVK